jgi:Ala-tRNA(Pro) deacylase
MNVQEFLIERSVEFDVIAHRDTYDAQRLAQTLHVSGEEVAKTVLLRADSGYAYIVAILPASKQVNLVSVSAAMGGSKIELASEGEIKQHCPDCEFGALPPFGTQYAMKTLVDVSLIQEDEIIFEGNNHHEAIRMRYMDFKRVEEPLVADFAVGPERTC